MRPAGSWPRRAANCRARRCSACPVRPIGVDEIVAAINEAVPQSRGQIEHGERLLPFPGAFDGAPIEAALGRQRATPLVDGVAQTIACYRDAIARGDVDDAFLDRVLAA